MLQRVLRALDFLIYLLLGILLLTASNPISNEPAGRARRALNGLLALDL